MNSDDIRLLCAVVCDDAHGDRSVAVRQIGQCVVLAAVDHDLRIVRGGDVNLRVLLLYSSRRQYDAVLIAAVGQVVHLNFSVENRREYPALGIS